MLLSISFSCISGLLRSRYLYLSLNSSFVLRSFTISKGVVSASESILVSFTLISICPVGMFSLIAALSVTTPVAAITNSFLNFAALLKASVPQSCSSYTSCNIPERSLRSMKIRPPLFLYFATQPITVTVLPISAMLSSVHLWVLCNPFIDSAIIPSSLYKIS